MISIALFLSIITNVALALVIVIALVTGRRGPKIGGPRAARSVQYLHKRRIVRLSPIVRRPRMYMFPREERRRSGGSLPDSPTEEEVSRLLFNYEKRLIGARSFRRNVLPEETLKKIPKEHFHLLVEYMSRSPIGRELESMVAARITDDDKQMVVDAFEYHGAFASTILHRGWVHDAEGALIRRIRSGNRIMYGDSSEMIRLIKSIDSDQVWTTIEELLIDQPHLVYAFRDLQSESKFKSIFQRVWNRHRFHLFMLQPLIEGAIENGVLDALALGVEILPQLDWHGQERILSAIRACTDFKGQKRKLRKWFLNVSDELRFNDSSGKFETG